MAKYMILVVDLDAEETTVLSSDTKPTGAEVSPSTGTPHGKSLRLSKNGGPLAIFHTASLRCTWFFNGQSWYEVCVKT